ncbi:MAG: DHH family phosphoesterase [Flavobacteriaceae bacterium]|nr:DHH family phosphoesterase [Flavobacteriaceae bacterium]
MTSELIEKTKELLATKKNIVIVSHRNPDGDAMGSSLAMYHYLIKKGHNVTVILPNEAPNFLKWMPKSEDIINFEKNTDLAYSILNKSDFVFTLDFNALHRVGDYMKIALNNYKKPFYMIDHHIDPSGYAKMMYSDSSMSSTCEMVYNFIVNIGDKALLDKDTATCIYTGIVTDTGSFRFASTTKNTHNIASELIELGIENSNIHSDTFDSNSLSRLALLGKALNSICVLEEYNTAYIYLTKEDLTQCNHQKGDTDGIVNYALSVKGVRFAVIFIEDLELDIIKLSLRSKGCFSVNEFANKYFNGGGHKNASGGKSVKNMEDTIVEFKNILKNYKKELNK